MRRRKPRRRDAAGTANAQLAIVAKSGNKRLWEWRGLGANTLCVTTLGASAGNAFADCTSPPAPNGPYHAVLASRAKRIASRPRMTASAVRREEVRSANLPDIRAVYHVAYKAAHRKMKAMDAVQPNGNRDSARQTKEPLTAQLCRRSFRVPARLNRRFSAGDLLH